LKLPPVENDTNKGEKNRVKKYELVFLPNVVEAYVHAFGIFPRYCNHIIGNIVESIPSPIIVRFHFVSLTMTLSM
jgi:hypothetical protein